MKILAAGGILFVSLLVTTGCQCNTWGDRYSDLIDDISDHEGNWDSHYNPCHDISRIGRPDWCQSKWNRRFCPCACEASGYCANCDAVHFAGPGVEIPADEVPEEIPLEDPPAPGKLKLSQPKENEQPLELPPKPGKKKSGYKESLEE